MNDKTKILVLHMREVIYTGIFIFLGIVFLILMAVMFLPRHSELEETGAAETVQTTESGISDAEGMTGQYTPGLYSATLEVSGSTMEMQVIIEQTGITDVSFTNLDESVETMFPLFPSVLDKIAEQLRGGTALSDITYEDTEKYTASLLLDALEEVLASTAR